MEASTISSKYQVVIPKKFRERYNLKPGYKVVFIPFEGTLRVVFSPPLEKARGMFPGIDTTVDRDEEVGVL
jgi:AbrB family looped-hinge helix DNA binding protein